MESVRVQLLREQLAKIMEKLWILLGLISLVECSRIIPPLYRYDDHDGCHDTGAYCFVRIVFKQDRDPFDTSRITTDFRRNLLDWGICIKECQRELEHFGEEDRQSLFQPKFEINFPYIVPADLWDQYLDPFKANYSELINICVNNRLKRDYNFDRLAYSEIEYCQDGAGTSRWTPGWSVIAFYAIVLALASLLIYANVIDWLGQGRLEGHIIVSSFSVRRNWTLLTKQSRSDLYRDFGYIDGVRVILSLLVMSLHYLILIVVIPLQNPEYIEEVVTNHFMVDIVTSSAVLVQIFFAISGLLLTTSVLKDKVHYPKYDLRYARNKIKARLIRIVPVYYFFLLVTIVIPDLPEVHVGPVGYKALIQEQARCRKKWWTNVVFLSNLPPLGGQVCNQQGWYLSADLQLFVVALAIVIACGKYPKHARNLVSSCVVISLAIPIGIVYLLGLESSLPFRLSDAQFQHMYQSWIKHVYMPSYSNFTSYTAGVVIGYIYHQNRHNNLNLDDFWIYNIIKRARVPLLALAYLPTFVFYRYEIPRSSWLTIIHTVLYRNAGVIAFCVTLIECFQNPPGTFRRFLSSKPMTSLGKLSFAVYVLHVPLVRIILNWIPPTLELKWSSPVWMVPFFVGVYLIGLCVYLCIEQPISLVLKHYWLGKN